VTSDSILIAGAGIGGLTAALALARQGFRVMLFDQAEKLEEAGAGIQLAPNATRILAGLGLGERLEASIVRPTAIRLRSGASGREIAVMPLDGTALESYGAPYWVIHRADLQKALTAAAADEPRIALTLGAAVDDVTIGKSSVRATVRRRCPGQTTADYDGTTLIGADGLWSRLRALLGDTTAARFAGRGAFRAIVPAWLLPPSDRAPVINVWLGAGGHVVHYPVRAGAAVNIVAVCGGGWQSTTWSTDAGRDEALERFPARAWAGAVRDLLAAPERWQKWALYDRAPLRSWGVGPVTLLGDAAHPMLPFLAQGAAMAIEDAAVLVRELSRSPDDRVAALRRYETARRPRTAHVQRAARHNDFHYHLRQPAAFVRDAALRTLGGRRLLAQYDWIYGWRL
jgi:2-polyprenyl-6-methoxyphenol hydroxylase-like FAD-dependent oxidoreductase